MIKAKITQKVALAFSGKLSDAVHSFSCTKDVMSGEFGGLEWTEQADDLLQLIRLAQEQKYHVMLYTSMTEPELFTAIPELVGIPMWIKFGEYDATKRVYDYSNYGVLLATGNQYIKFCK